jgi:hypothetical protein
METERRQEWNSQNAQREGESVWNFDTRFGIDNKKAATHFVLRLSS